MKSRLKLLLVAILICIVLSGFSFTASSSNIKVLLNAINIMINDEVVDVDNILYEGVTYVPLRDMSELFQKEVAWDSQTNTVNVKDSEDCNPPCHSGHLETFLITNINADRNLELQLILHNPTLEEVTATFDTKLYYDIVIYNDEDEETYRYSDGLDYATVIWDEVIGSGKSFITKANIDLSDPNWSVSELYKVRFDIHYEIKSEKKDYEVYEENYFMIQNEQ
ncbi:BsuPI-related putative proteinase inhibitor [Longirhabdus pacifica]|uniref:BsuPI-related putative proteinase inhibitor n=1 Tax=Longirhabdus pacifica TaxID=2305227 RepID=UPI001008A97D|nr:BsuPI-related putative proteinase inhibitor [Longirhabdus pacifica]